MTTPLTIISGAMRSIGALEEGEPLGASAANDAFDILNDMLAQWSTQRMLIPYVTEVIFTLTGGTYQYTIGPGGTANAVVTASQAANTLTVTAIISGALALNQTIPTTKRIIAFGTGSGGQSANALGTYTVDGAATTIGSTSMTLCYQRPLRISSGFTRVSTIDYPLSVKNVEDYELIGLKALNGPWPKILYYQPSEPLGNLTFWPNPSSGEVHLFCDQILGSFNTITDVVNLPQGYNLGMRFSLAELLMPEYGKASPIQVQMIKDFAKDFRASIRSVNMQPQQVAHLDPMLLTSRRYDAGWIFSGGFN